MLNINSCSTAQQMHSVNLLLRLEGGVGILEFGFFWGGQNIFDFRGVLSYEGEVYFLEEGQSILRTFSHFEMRDFKNSKHFCLRRPHFQYSHFQI